MAKRQGKYTLIMQNPPTVEAWAAIGGKKEGEGPVGPYFDYTSQDSLFGQKSWESAESAMQHKAMETALKKGGINSDALDYVFAGDLLNQCVSSTFGLRELGVPLIGLFAACSTMAEGLGLSALFVEGGLARRAAAVTSSHFCSAEKQFRFPLEYGGQRPPTSQWTATAAGAAVVAPGTAPPYVRGVTFGRIIDLGIKDPNNMGAAMAPAAADTFCNFFADTATNPTNYDLIITGDLGRVGSELFIELLRREGYHAQQNHSDCGLMLFDPKLHPQVGAGGSGCGCSASVLCSLLLGRIRDGGLQNILFAATGALMSTTTCQQGESIPGVAHLLWLSGLSS